MIEILDFYATWCKPCKTLEATLHEVEKQLTDDVFITPVDIEEDEDKVDLYNIKNVPTLIFLKDGIVVDKQVGNISKYELLKRIELCK